MINVRGLLLAIGVLLLPIAGLVPGIRPVAMAGPGANDIARQAYELRMCGGADEAESLLEDALTRRPRDAALHYELARTSLQLALAEPSSLGDRLEAADRHIAKAIELDPDNVAHRFFGGRIAFFRAYMALQQNEEAAADRVAEVCAAYEKVLELRPDCREAELYLVEIYGVLPPEAGGNPDKAEAYAAALEEADAVYGAKARALLLPEDADRVGYWTDVAAEHEGNADVLHELGRAHLFADDPEKAIDCFGRATAADPTCAWLAVEVARFHFMRFMRSRGESKEAATEAATWLEKYLATEPAPPLRAYALGMLARIRSMTGDTEGARIVHAEIDATDPHYSKAFGVPTPDLFVPPGEIPLNHRYLFTAF